MMWLPLLLIWLSLAFLVWFCRHQDRVSLYRAELLTKVVDAANTDALAGRDYQWRFDALTSVPYLHMAWRLWRKPESFYPNLNCTRPDAHVLWPYPLDMKTGEFLMGSRPH